MRVGGTQTIRIDARLLAATNAPLEYLVARRRFREDLYYRLKVITIHMPPLRERREDVPLLVQAFLQELAAETGKTVRGIRPEALEALVRYHWPGNVRELRNVVESMIVLARRPELTIADVPPAVRGAGPPVALALPAGGAVQGPASPAPPAAEGEDGRLAPPAPSPIAARPPADVSQDGRPLRVSVGMPMADIEREAILATLDAAGGNKTRAARMLQIGLRTLQRKLKEYGRGSD
jgi:DNA-binding NtrC family response regulator